MAEWAWVLKHSSGVIVRNAYQETTVIDELKLYEDIILREKKNKGGGEDHFAAAGAT